LKLDSTELNTAQVLSASQVNTLYKKYGAYEASKIESEFVLSHLAQQNNIPVTGILLGPVIGHSMTGELNQLTGIAALIKNIYHEKLPALPGSENDRLPLVTIDYLVDFITGIIRLPHTIGEKYIVLDEATPSLEHIVALISRHIGTQAPSYFVSKKLVKTLLNLGVDRLLGEYGSAESLDFIQPLSFDTHPMETVADQLGLAKPDIKNALLNTVDYLISNDFKEPILIQSSIPGGFYTIAKTQTFIKGNRSTASQVLLHGMPSNSDSWDHFSHLLEGSTLAVDIPNISRSRGQFSDTNQWMDCLLTPSDNSTNNINNSPTQLIAHSIGTGIALDFATSYPQKVNSLVLISPYFLQKPAPALVNIPGLAYFIKTVLSKKAFARLLTPDLDNNRNNNSDINNAFSNTRRRGAIKGIFKQLSISRQRTKREYFQRLFKNVRVPTLIIHGENEPLTEVIGSNNPNITIASIKNAGHNAHLTNAEETSSLINSFKTTKSTPRNKIQNI